MAKNIVLGHRAHQVNLNSRDGIFQVSIFDIKSTGHQERVLTDEEADSRVSLLMDRKNFRELIAAMEKLLNEPEKAFGAII